MSKKSLLPQSPRHFLIYDEDWDYLETRFGQSGLHPVGVSNVIRALIHREVLKWREAENTAATAAMRVRMERTNANPTHIYSTDGGPAGDDL